MDSDDIELRKLNAIVGSALRALVESGATDEFIGEFAASHRAKLVKIMCFPEEALQPVSLEQIVATAVAQALEKTGKAAAKSSKVPTQRINVIVGGRRTSITIGGETVARLVASKGEKQANEVIRDIASKVPKETKNRSGWIEERLQLLLSFADGEGASTHRH